MNNIYSYRQPNTADGPAIYHLVAECPPLAQNSRYCNLLQASLFCDSAIVVEHQGEICGFTTGFRVPSRFNTLFVWQIAVSPRFRGQGLAMSMLNTLLARMPEVDYLETTITSDNQSSEKVFKELALSVSAPIERFVIFESVLHFEGQQQDEILLRIGPFQKTPNMLKKARSLEAVRS